MTNRTALAILVTCAALLGFIFFFERGSMTSDEAEARSENVFKDLRVDFVTRIEIEGAKGKVVLERMEGDVERWGIAEPGEYRADETEVRALLSAMDFLLIERRVDGDPDSNKWGLKKPRLKGVVTFGDRKTAFFVGKETVDGNGVYMAVEGDGDSPYVVSLDFFDALDKGLDDLRDRRLLGFDRDAVTGLRVEGPAGKVELDLDTEKGWMIRLEGVTLRASQSEARRLLAKVVDLEAKRFLAEGSKGGPFKPKRTITVKLEKGEQRILLGTECDGGGWRATVSDFGQVACVGDDIIARLDKPAAKYLDLGLTSFSSGEVRGLTIERGGGRVTFEMDESGLWGSKDQDAAMTDQGALAALIDRLCNVSASKSAIDKDAASGGRVAVARVVFTLEDKSTREVSFGSMDDGEIVAIRDKEPLLLTVDKSILEDLLPDALAFRRKLLQSGDPALVERLDISGVLEQTLEKRDGKWLIGAPVMAVADKSAAEGLAQLLTRTMVEGYVIEDGAFGFDKPFATIRARLAVATEKEGTVDQTETEELVMDIGAEAGDGLRYGRVSGKDLVFTIGEAAWKPLEVPMAALDALRLESEGIDRVEVRMGSRRIEAKLVDGDWTSEDCDLDGTKLKRLLIDLGAVKAIGTRAFGKAIVNRELELRLYGNDSEEPAVLEFGGRVGEVDGILGRRTDLDVIYVMPRRPVDEFLEICM